MVTDQLMDAIGCIDDIYIEEARLEGLKRKRIHQFLQRSASTAAACAVLVLVGFGLSKTLFTSHMKGAGTNDNSSMNSVGEFDKTAMDELLERDELRFFLDGEELVLMKVEVMAGLDEQETPIERLGCLWIEEGVVFVNDREDDYAIYRIVNAQEEEYIVETDTKFIRYRIR